MGEINLYKLWGDYNFLGNEQMDGFLICGIGKLMALQKGNQLLLNKIIANCKLLVVDEAHKAAAEETRKLIKSFMLQVNGNDRGLLGLTATPGRSTGLSIENELLTSLFDGNLIGIDVEVMSLINNSRVVAKNTDVEKDIIRYFQNKGVLARIKKEALTYQSSFTQGELDQIKIQTIGENKDFSNKALEVIGRNRNRNYAIVERLKALNREGVPTIVFACSVKHAQLLSAFLAIEGIPNAIAIGDMPTQDRANAIKKFKDRNDPTNILINFEVLTTGFDSTNIRCVFVARPTQSVVLYSQILGRGMRGPQMGGNEECLLVDVQDNLQKYDEHLAYKHFNNYW
jgi:superfamily II DNA or RNA helicase